MHADNSMQSTEAAGRPARASVSALLRYVHAARQFGVDTEAILQAMGWQLSDLQDARKRVPAEQHERLLAKLVEAADTPLFGLQAGLIVQADAWTVLGYILINSETLGAAMNRVLSYEKLVGELGVSRVECLDQGRIRMSWHARVEQPSIRRHMVENVLASWFAFGQWMADTQESPVEVHFEHACPEGVSVGAYEAVFGCPVHFERAISGIVVQSSTLQLPLRQADPALLEVLEHHAQQQLQDIDAAAPVWSERVRQMLLRCWPKGSVGKEEIAHSLNVTSRTLQRHLAREGTSYQLVMDDLRKTLAFRWLRTTDMPLAAIAEGLGFVEMASFYRRFRQWTQMTPGEYRSAQLSEMDNQTVPKG